MVIVPNLRHFLHAVCQWYVHKKLSGRYCQLFCRIWQYGARSRYTNSTRNCQPQRTEVYIWWRWLLNLVHFKGKSKCSLMAALGPLSEGKFLSILTLHNTLFESIGPAKRIATRQEIFDRKHFYRPPLHCYGRYPDVYVCSNTMSTHKLLPRQCTRELDVSQPHRSIFIPQLLPTNFKRGYPNHIFADDNIFPSSS